MMGSAHLDCSLIQLRLANHYQIEPIGHLENVKFELRIVKIMVYFEVIGIVDDQNTYPALLGFEWENDSETILGGGNVF